ncbi:MAG: Mov34/MPN/PAD-1 family protein [Alphaproteobacteria bacterium]
MNAVLMPDALRRRILDEARGAHPAECCGLVVGGRDGQRFNVLALHPARNLSALIRIVLKSIPVTGSRRRNGRASREPL